MVRHRATRPSIASVVSTTSTNGTRSRPRLSYEQSTLLALAENGLKKRKKPLNISAIVKDAERRAQEQGLSLGIQARTRIKKVVEKLGESGAVTAAPRKSRAPAEFSLTPKAAKVYNDAKARRRSQVGIAREMADTLKGSERPAKRRRSSVSTVAASSSRSSQQTTIEKLKADLAAARSEISYLKQSNQDLLDQQLEDDEDYDAFGSPTRETVVSHHDEAEQSVRHSARKGLSFPGNRPTRPTTPEPTEHGSPEYEAPGEFGYVPEMDREMTPPSSSLPDGTAPQIASQDNLGSSEKSEMGLKLERLEASMAELALEKARMAEEITELKNQVHHEREIVAGLTREKNETDLVRVELAQDRDLALKEISRLEQANTGLETRCASMALEKEQLEVNISLLEADIQTHADAQSEIHTQLVAANQELEAAKLSLSQSQDEARRLTESFAMANSTIALLNGNLSARESTIAELQGSQALASERLQTLRAEAQTLRDSLSIAEGQVSNAGAIVIERDHQIAGLTAEQEALQATVAGLLAQKIELVSQNGVLKGQVEEFNATTNDLRAQVERLGAEIVGLGAQVTELQSSLNTARSEKEQLQARAEAERAEASYAIAQHDTKIEELGQLATKLESDLESRTRQLSERQMEIARLNKALAESTNAVKSLKDANKSITDKLDGSVKEVKTLNDQINNLQKKDESNLRCIDELNKSLAQHKDSLEEHQDLISKLELQLERLRGIELKSLRKRRARYEAEAKRLKDEEAELTQEAIDVDQWDEHMSQSRAARSSLAPSFAIPSSP